MSSEAPTMREVAEALLLDQTQRGRLLGYAVSRFGIAEEDAEDLLQDTALELLRHSRYVRNPPGFVFTSFRNRCTRFLLAHRGGAEVPAREGDLERGRGSCAGTEGLDRRIAFRQAFSGISPSCRQLLLAHYIEGETLAEAARRMTIDYFSVSKTINRCLRRLRECLN